MHEDVDAILDDVSYGDASFTVKMFNNKPVRLQGNVAKSRKFNAAEDNAVAGATVIQLMKDATEAGFTGNISFTIAMQNGVITRLIKTGNADLSYHLQKPPDSA